MNDPQFTFWVIPAALVWSVIAVFFVWRIGKSLVDRHTRRISDCDEGCAPDEWSVTIGPYKPGDCDVCDARRAKIERERR